MTDEPEDPKDDAADAPAAAGHAADDQEPGPSAADEAGAEAGAGADDEPAADAKADDEPAADGDDEPAADEQQAQPDAEKDGTEDGRSIDDLVKTFEEVLSKEQRVGRERGLLGYAGWAIASLSFVAGVLLLFASSYYSAGTYTALVTYTMIPAGIAFGFSLVGLSAFLGWRRRVRGGVAKPLPVLDLNLAWPRRIVLLAMTVGMIFMVVSGVATYRTYVYTESTEFCGTVCHSVMNPEYVAYQRSTHARVPCGACHIGHGPEAYAMAKLNGLRQVYQVVTGSYSLPIETPLHNLRPARDTCEQCHWPAKFSGSLERVEHHFWFDKDNTPSVYHLLMRIGGLNPQTGQPEGIHWHTSSNRRVRYWASDRKLLDIPYVEVDEPDGTRTIFRSTEATADPPPGSELKQMDCIDCHNRPAHIFRAPAELINEALAAGRLDRTIPFIKRNAVEILTKVLDDEGIRGELERRYSSESEYPLEQERIELAGDVLVEFYKYNHFPDQKVDWRTHPHHLGHRVFPGCFRCHDGKHVSSEGKVIPRDCNLCHDIVHQAWGDAADEPVVYRTQPFEHPGGQGDMHEEGLCMECHAADVGELGHGAESRVIERNRKKRLWAQQDGGVAGDSPTGGDGASVPLDAGVAEQKQPK